MVSVSKVILTLSCGVSAGILGYVQYKQFMDRKKLHEGVMRDIEQQQRRKLETTYLLPKHIDLSNQLKDLQSAQEDAATASTGENLQ